MSFSQGSAPIKFASQAEIEAGTEGEKAIAPDAMLAALGITQSFASSEQTITAGGLLTIAHGFGVEPELIQLRLICKTADSGWAVNDEIIVSQAGSTSSTRNQAVYFNSTNIYIRYEDGSQSFAYSNKSTGVSALLTNSKWKLIVRAWA